MIKLDIKFDDRNIEAGLAKFEAKVKDSVIFSGAAAMAREIYAEVKLNTSPQRMNRAGGRREEGRPPGTLHNAVYRAFSPEQSPDGKKVYHVSVNKSKAPHWWLIEYGSSRQPAYPYIRPAIDKLPEAIRAGNEAMRKRLTEA